MQHVSAPSDNYRVNLSIAITGLIGTGLIKNKGAGCITFTRYFVSTWDLLLVAAIYRKVHACMHAC